MTEIIDIEKKTPENLEDAFQNLFQTAASATGEEELLRIASTYSRQITSAQIRLLLFLEDRAYVIEEKYPVLAMRLKSFVKNWLEYKQYNNSDVFVMKALEHISLRKFLNENSLRVNIEK